MPAVTSGTVLVTGANGFVAMWLIRKLLERGFTVRGTVRSENKVESLKQVFNEYGDKLEIYVVPDITKEGAYDEVIKGVDVVEHTASPVHLEAVDPDEQIIPAVKGTLRVLESALAHGTSVRRVIYTSTCGAIRELNKVQRVYTEADWNDRAVAEVRARGREASQLEKYQASKVLAERAAWDFVEKNKGEIIWDLVVLNPPWIFGPTLQPVSTPDELNESMRMWFLAVIRGTDSFGQPLGKEGFDNADMTWVDVRDVAEGLAAAAEKEEAGGERIVVSHGPWNGEDILSVARRYYPYVATGDPATATYLTTFDTSKAQRLLGIKYHTLEESTRDIIEQYKAKGWI